MLLTVLILAAPLLTLVYAIGEQFKWWDRISGRDKAIEGLRRLKSGAGFPVSWIFDDEQDRKVFQELERRITKRTSDEKLSQVLKAGHRPSLIATAGHPLRIDGVPAEWPQEARAFYSGQHPILYLFNVSRTGTREGDPGKAGKACNLADVERWLEEEKVSRRFWVSSVGIGILAGALLVVRAALV